MVNVFWLVFKSRFLHDTVQGKGMEVVPMYGSRAPSQNLVRVWCKHLIGSPKNRVLGLIGFLKNRVWVSLVGL